jgi:hypothetical protein
MVDPTPLTALPRSISRRVGIGLIFTAVMLGLLVMISYESSRQFL